MQYNNRWMLISPARGTLSSSRWMRPGPLLTKPYGRIYSAFPMAEPAVTATWPGRSAMARTPGLSAQPASATAAALCFPATGLLAPMARLPVTVADCRASAGCWSSKACTPVAPLLQDDIHEARPGPDSPEPFAGPLADHHRPGAL